jgi:inhibitor of KinA sporulation pathway (predicted exonuclease)
LKNLHPQVTLERTGTHHHALDDARYQAMHLMKILNVGGLATQPAPQEQR